MDELFKPCGRPKLCLVLKKLLPRETVQLFTSDDPGSCFYTLACVKARESI